MLVSETEAREKWCPFARVLKHTGSAAAAVNRTNQENLLGTCLGSQCMAWRFGVLDDVNGYCGLAGQPSGKVI